MAAAHSTYPALDRACAEAVTRIADAKLHTPGGELAPRERAAIIGNIIRRHRINSIELDRAMRAARAGGAHRCM